MTQTVKNNKQINKKKTKQTQTKYQHKYNENKISGIYKKWSDQIDNHGTDHLQVEPLILAK